MLTENTLPSTSSSSNHSSFLKSDSIAASLLSSIKFQKTLIVQPPTSSQSKCGNNLAKRYKASELGDLLMKKIKTQVSGTNSPTLRENSNEYDSSMLEEIDSPSTRSDYEHAIEKTSDQRANDHVLIPQRSISMPLAINNFNIKPFKGEGNDSQRQIRHALDVLQKKMMIEQQAASLKDILLKIKLTHEPLVIPPLLIPSNLPENPIRRLVSKTGEEEPEIIYGEVEYPFLSLSTPFLTTEPSQTVSTALQTPAAKKEKSNSKQQKAKPSSNSSPSEESSRSFDGGVFELRDFLSATRAETQKSESELGNALKDLNEGKKKTKRATGKKEKIEEESNEKSLKRPRKEKEVTKQSKREMESPAIPSKRKLNDRKKNK